MWVNIYFRPRQSICDIHTESITNIEKKIHETHCITIRKKILKTLNILGTGCSSLTQKNSTTLLLVSF